MAVDPVLAYTGEGPGQDISVVLFGGAAVTVRGKVANLETSPGDASQPFGNFGPVAWISYSKDPTRIEFVEYRDAASGNRLHRRSIRGERTSSIFDTCRLQLAREVTVMPAPPADFSSRDFGPDFATD